MSRDTGVGYGIKERPVAEPLLKWAGGKRQIIPKLLHLAPQDFKVYYEPFVGGGALLTALYNRGLLRGRAVISDTNRDLIGLYRLIKQDPEALINELKRLEYGNNRESYYRARREFNETKGFTPRKGALLIYLNRHCFNGLWRVNSKGEFNVPFGRYRRTSLPSKDKIMAFHHLLTNVEIYDLDFEEVVERAKVGDFIYFDPPYFPISETAYFTSYVAEGFSWDAQLRLYRVVQDLSKKGVMVIVSNSGSPEIRKLYEDYRIYEVETNRAINSDPSQRTGSRELIIMNY